MCTGTHERDSLSITQSPVSCKLSEPRRIWGPRLLPAQQAELVGLAIVAAIQSEELDTYTSSGRANQHMPSHPVMPANQLVPRHPTMTADHRVPRNPTNPANQQKPRHYMRIQEKSKSSKMKGPSIFTISSPSSCLNASSPQFSSSCYLCKRPLPSNKDIYMYRGNQAFCTKQCRHHQMVVDESKEKMRSCTIFTTTKCHVDPCIATPNYYKHKERIFAYA